MAFIPIGDEQDMLFFPYNSEDLTDDDGNIITDANGIVIGDRMYDADDEALIFKQFFRNGVFPNPLVDVPTNANSQGLRIVAQQNTMTLTQRMGAAFVEGRRFVLKRDVDFTLDPAHPTLGRRDVVIVRHDAVARSCAIGVITGTPAIAPQIPVLIRTDDIWDIRLAVITVNPNAHAITAANVLDTRMDTDVCGFVTGAVTTVDTRDLFLQIEAVVNEALQFWADERLTWEQKQAKWQQVQEDFMEAWRLAQAAWTQEQKDLFEVEFDRVRNLIAALQTQSFTLVNNDFSATWNKPGCRLVFDPATLTSTWIIEADDSVLATSVFEPATLTTTVTFNAWENTIGGNAFISLPRTWQEVFDPVTLTTRIIGGIT